MLNGVCRCVSVDLMEKTKKRKKEIRNGGQKKGTSTAKNGEKEGNGEKGMREENRGQRSIPLSSSARSVMTNTTRRRFIRSRRISTV